MIQSPYFNAKGIIVMDFKDLRFESIIPILKEKLQNTDEISLRSNNKDIKGWSDLANIFFCKIIHINSFDTFIEITLQKINLNKSFHSNSDIETKYGKDSVFSKIDKMNQPAFLHYYLQALNNIKIEKRIRILNLGINSGEEFEIIKNISSCFENQEFVGIDYCSSAIESAQEKFKKDSNVHLYSCDINDLEKFNFEKFDCIITIGTLQSTSLEFKPTFMKIIQEYLKKDGALIMGFPNCRWYDGQMVYGAKAPNYSFSEMSLLFNDVVWCKKYLQQKKFRVTITGKEYIFLTATSIR